MISCEEYAVKKRRLCQMKLSDMIASLFICNELPVFFSQAVPAC